MENEHACPGKENGFVTTSDAQKAKAFYGTVLGWEVGDIHATIRELTARGVRFEQFNLPFLKQDEHGVWTPPSGDQAA